jgi:putative transcriptional regulator
MENPSAGTLLIADPFLQDPHFLRSVVLICEHQEVGSFGFVLNRQADTTLEALMEAATGVDLPVYYGGPVQPDSLHFLHQYPEEIQGSQLVAEDIYWGGDVHAAIELIRNQKIDPNRIRFFIGYSGWSEGQLKEELSEKSWITAQANTHLVFFQPSELTWKAALSNLGGEYKMMIHFPIDPQLN